MTKTEQGINRIFCNVNTEIPYRKFSISRVLIEYFVM